MKNKFIKFYKQHKLVCWSIVLIILLEIVPLFFLGIHSTATANHPILGILALPAQDLLGAIGSGTHSYGLAIIIVTILINLLLTPAMMLQFKVQDKISKEMKQSAPRMRSLQKRMSHAGTKETKQKLAHEVTETYRTKLFNFDNIMSYVPMLVQLIVFSSLYAALQFLPSLAHMKFLGLALGSSSGVAIVLVYLVYLVENIITSKMENNGKINKAIVILGPLFMLAVAAECNFSIDIYLIITGIFVTLQIYFINKQLKHNQ